MTTAHQKRLDFRANLAAGKFMIAPGIYMPFPRPASGSRT